MRKTLILLILAFLAISTISVISTENISRVLVNNSKAIYKDNLFGVFYEYFKSLESIKSYFNIPKAIFNNEVTKEKFEFVDNYYTLDAISIPQEKEAEITLNDDCGVNHKSTTSITFTYTNKNAQYTKGTDSPKTVSISEMKFEVKNLVLSRTPLTTSPIFQHNFVSYDEPVLTLKFTGAASAESEVFFNIPEMKAALITKLKKVIDSNLKHQVILLNSQNVNELNLNVSNLPDGKPAYLKTQLAELPNCKGDFILEKFAASITESYQATTNLDYTFDSTKSDSQVIYDFNLLIDELIQSRVLNNRFKFTVSKDNASDISTMGFKIDNLANILPYIKFNYLTTDEFIADCVITKASSKSTPPANDVIPSITVAEIKCELKDLAAIPDLQIIETIYAEYVITLNYTINTNKELVVSFSKVDLYDDGITTQKIYNFEALTKVLARTMDNYIRKNPIELFKLDNNKEKSGVFEILPKGILYYISKTPSDNDNKLKFLNN